MISITENGKKVRKNSCFNREPIKAGVLVSQQFPLNQWIFKNSIDCKYSVESGKKDLMCKGCRWNQAETAIRRLAAIKDSKFMS